MRRVQAAYWETSKTPFQYVSLRIWTPFLALLCGASKLISESMSAWWPLPAFVNSSPSPFHVRCSCCTMASCQSHQRHPYQERMALLTLSAVHRMTRYLGKTNLRSRKSHNKDISPQEILNKRVCSFRGGKWGYLQLLVPVTLILCLVKAFLARIGCGRSKPYMIMNSPILMWSPRYRSSSALSRASSCWSLLAQFAHNVLKPELCHCV